MLVVCGLIKFIMWLKKKMAVVDQHRFLSGEEEVEYPYGHLADHYLQSQVFRE